MRASPRTLPLTRHIAPIVNAPLYRRLKARGVNSRRTKDMQGRVFAVPVDAEHKATYLKITNFANPHMHAFHAAWFGFFSTFFSTFAPAPLKLTPIVPWFEPR